MSGRVLAVAVSVWVGLSQFGVWAVAQADGKTSVRRGAALSEAGSLTEVPFTISANEVKNVVSIYTGEQSFPAIASGTVPLDVDDAYYTFVYLFNADHSVVAKDIVHPDIKMSLEFSAANSARAEIFDALRLTVLPYAELGVLYNQIDQQKKFPELVAAYKKDRRIRSDMATFRLAMLIADDLATTYLNQRSSR